MESLVANLSPKTKTKQLGGRTYIVAPVVMIVEGVFAGNQGACLYRGEHIAQAVSSWNNKPITINHPRDNNGVFVSAGTSDVLEKFGVGFVLNTKWDPKTKKLKAEAWFDVERLDRVYGGEKIKASLLNGTPAEVSTGLFIDKQAASGIYQGKEYVGEATNHRPDHLAMIIEGVGACSLKDGAGLLVNREAKTLEDQIQAKLQATTPDETRTVLFVNEAEGFVVYNTSGETFVENFEVVDKSVKLLGSREKLSVEALVANEKALKVSKEKLAQALGEAHKEFVANLSAEQVSAILALEKTVEVEVEVPVEKVVEVQVANKAATVEEALASLPENLKAQVTEALAVNAAHRESLIETIAAAPANKFSREELAAFNTDTLTKLSGFAVNTAQAPAAKGQALFAGAGSTVPPAGTIKQKGFLPPSSFEPKKG